jgi:hypothetical protein
MDVAVKTLREDETIENQKRWAAWLHTSSNTQNYSFLAEARLMRQLRHDNVVRWAACLTRIFHPKYVYLSGFMASQYTRTRF